MNFYKLPKIEFPKLRVPKIKPFWRSKIFIGFLIVLLSFIFGGIGGLISGSYFYSAIKDYLAKFGFPESQIIQKEKIIEKEYLPQTSQEKAIIDAVNEISPAVVSIIITKDLPILEEYYISPFEEPFFEFKIPQYRQKGVEKKQIGGGSGFIISEDGMILTNRHVVSFPEAEYTILTNDGRKFPAKVLATDPIQDLAVIKIDQEKMLDKKGEFYLKSFPTVRLGDSDKLQIGQTVIAIGNALGEFKNTVSVGVISGLGRKITAAGEGIIETLEDVIQTDAAINQGNSGGPLLNLKGEVVGINTAMVLEAQNIGFAIPINYAKKDIEQVKAKGKIVYPFLGIRYVLVTESIQKEKNLPVDYGALIIKGQGEPAIYPDSAAQIAGLREGDIVLEFNGEKITTENSLAKIIMKYNPGDKVVLKIQRGSEQKIIEITLGERSE